MTDRPSLRDYVKSARKYAKFILTPEFARFVLHGLKAKSTEEFYDSFSPYYDEFFGDQVNYAEHARVILEAYLTRMARHFDIVLDCGCGTGVFSAELEELFDELHGIDFSAGQLSEVQERGLDMTLTQGNVLSLPYASSHFHLVTSLGMIRHLPEEMFTGYVKEACRVLKPGGLLFIEPIPVMPSLSDPKLGPLVAKAYNAFMEWRGLDECIGEMDIESTLSDAGFVVEKIKVTDSETEMPLYDVFVGRKLY